MPKVLAIVYGIRHKPTGKYLPAPKGRQGRGGSHVEPSELPPRQFSTERSAKIALNLWLKGKYVCSRGVNYGHPGNDWEDDYYEEVDVIPQEHRVKADMEIVKLILTEAEGG